MREGWLFRSPAARDRGVTRRDAFIAMMAGAATLAGCSASDFLNTGKGSSRLQARPHAPSGAAEPGTTTLGLGGTRDGLLLVPESYSAATPSALVVALHGAGGSAANAISLLQSYAESRGFLVLAVDSRGTLWDASASGFGPDVAFIDQALASTFDRCAVDPARIVLQGFSDGASYTLGLGLTNGDLFTRLVAFSPGYIPDSSTPWTGKPPVFISHGRQDPVIPIDSSSRVIVGELLGHHYDVTYLEFDGGHDVPPAILASALDWFAPDA